MHEQHAEKMLIFLLLSDNDETKAAASHALAIMAESNYCQDAIRNYGQFIFEKNYSWVNGLKFYINLNFV